MVTGMRRRRGVMLAVGMVVALSSNCSLSRGRTQLVEVRSVPLGAQVSLNGEPVGETPVHVEVGRRDADPVLRVGKAGFEPVEQGLDRRLAGWFLGGDIPVALLLGGLAAVGGALSSWSAGASIGYGGLWSTAVLAPPLALGTAFEFRNEVEIVLQRSDGVGGAAGTARKLARPVFDVRSELLGIREGLANGGAGIDGTGLRERLRAVKVDGGGEWSGSIVERAPKGRR